MSIEKIKERIKMIEEGDYTLKELVSTFEPAQLNAFAKDMSKSRGDAGVKAAQNLKKTLNVGGKALSSAQNSLDIARGAFNGGNQAYVGNLISLPPKDEPVIFKIYNAMRSHGVLSSDIDNTNQPKHGGYSERGNRLLSEKTHEIEFVYDDPDLTNLVTMAIDFKRNKYKQRDVDSFVAEMTNNGASYGVKGIHHDTHNNTVTLKFN